jgi:hypothetical protein
MVRFVALNSDSIGGLQRGGLDANGQPCEAAVSSGGGAPCRHCLQQIEAGDDYLILSYRPFSVAQPYAEQGPIFLHVKRCGRHQCDEAIPKMLKSAHYIVRGYSAIDRIVYGTGVVTPTKEISNYAAELLANSAVAYVHVRSAANNCYQCRIDRT